ncbi:MAG: hypothetical protein HW380_2676 [Magnetococcales bacterium]|nr:hypothetical protein [Magnetococcales bacterium]HIJ84323.1 hypothetical protein [Magnetococcales bacterium]
MKTTDKRYQVGNFYPESFINLLSELVNRPKSEVRKKLQVSYLIRYIQALIKEKPHYLNQVVMVTENKHEDRDNLMNYAEFDVFTSSDLYQRHSKRIHFFHGRFLESQLDRIFDGFHDGNVPGTKDLADRYIGSVVIRINQGAFIAKTLLPHLKYLKEDAILPYLRSYKVGLFGILLEVKETIAWQEQDRVVAACASSSLWFTYHALQHDINSHRFPFPAGITLSATRDRKRTSSVFPNQGLTIPEMAQSIRSQGMEPYHLKFDFPQAMEPEGYKQMIRHLFAYTQKLISVPILVLCNYSYDEKGEKVKAKDIVSDENILAALGDTDLIVVRTETSSLHTVTILGLQDWRKLESDNSQKLSLGRQCWKSENPITSRKMLRSVADRIQFLVVHDDQVGMFARIFRPTHIPFVVRSGPYYDDKDAKSHPHYLGPFGTSLEYVRDSENNLCPTSRLIEGGTKVCETKITATVPDTSSDNSKAKGTGSADDRGETKYICMPESIILGFHPKVRAHYPAIQGEILFFENDLQQWLTRNYWEVSADETESYDSRLYYAEKAIELQDSFWPDGFEITSPGERNLDSISAKRLGIDNPPQYEWEIRINRSHYLLEQLREQYRIQEKNEVKETSIKIENKPVDDFSKSILLKPWPLFVWRATAWWRGRRMIDIFFDATDPRPCNFVFHIAVYHRSIDNCASTYLFHTLADPDNRSRSDELHSSVLNHWVIQIYGNREDRSQKEERKLVADFGNAVLPEKIHDHEKGDQYGVVLLEKRMRCLHNFWLERHETKDSTLRYMIDIKVVDFFKDVVIQLEKDRSSHEDLYDNSDTKEKAPLMCLWLVDMHGELRIGLEERVSATPRKKRGHPCLTTGGSARMAGEIIRLEDMTDGDNLFKRKTGRKVPSETQVWFVNNKSGRYTKFAKERSVDRLKHVVEWMNKLAEVGGYKATFVENYDPGMDGVEVLNSEFDARHFMVDIIKAELKQDDLLLSCHEMGRLLYCARAGQILTTGGDDSHKITTGKNHVPTPLEILCLGETIADSIKKDKEKGKDPDEKLEKVFNLEVVNTIAARVLAHFWERTLAMDGPLYTIGVDDAEVSKVLNILIDWSGGKDLAKKNAALDTLCFVKSNDSDIKNRIDNLLRGYISSIGTSQEDRIATNAKKWLIKNRPTVSRIPETPD